MMAFNVRSGPGRLALPNIKRSPSVRGAEFLVKLHKGKRLLDIIHTFLQAVFGVLGSEGGLGLQLAELKSNKEECGVFIKKIAPGSPAAQSELLRYI